VSNDRVSEIENDHFDHDHRDHNGEQKYNVKMWQKLDFSKYYY